MKHLYAGLLSLFLGTSSFAQVQNPLSLEECLQKALEQNLQIKVASNDVRKANRQIAETRAALLPQISGEYNFTYSPDLPPVFCPVSLLGSRK